MSSETAGVGLSGVINIKVDGEKFARTRFSRSSTVAQLRKILSEKHNLSSNTHFLDNTDYPLAKVDEETELVEVLLHVDNIVLIETHEITSAWVPATHTQTLNKRGGRIINTGGTFFITELISILRWLWYLILKPLVVASIILLLLYYGYTKTVCRYARFLPYVTMYCPVDGLELISVPPVGELAAHSTSLADTLMNADVSAPMRFVQAKTSLIQLRNQVIYSDIDIGVKEKLSEQMGELQRLIQTGADQLTSMLTSFGGTMDKLRIYTKFALDDLTKVINQGIARENNQLQIGKVNNIGSA